MNRFAVFIVAIFLLLPSGVNAEWTMFGKDANHSGVADTTVRTIQDREPVVSWDKGSSSSDEEVYSWGTVVGNFTPNISGDTYDRNVLHVVYITAEEVDDELRGKLVMWDGGNQKPMWEKDLGLIEDQNGQSLENDFTSFDSAYATPAIADFDGDGLTDIAVIKPNGEVYFYEPVIQYFSDNENYDADSNSQSWSYDADITVVRSNPVVTDLNGGNDLIFSGIDLDSSEINVIAVDGSTGNRLWQFIEDGSEVSSPAILKDSSNRKVFVSVYDSGNFKVYGIQNGDVLSDWNGKINTAILDPQTGAHHPLLPSIVIADLTTDSGKEILVPQPPSTSGGDAQLWLFDSEGNDAAGWDGSNPYDLDGGGDMDATPAVGDIDSDGKAEIVAVTWSDSSTTSEVTHVWALSADPSVDWYTTYDTSNPGLGDNDEHAISSPILAVIHDEDGSDNLDVFTCTTPDCYALDGNDGGNGDDDDEKDSLWDISLDNRGGDNRIYNSPAATDVDGDGLLDLVVDGSVYSANLADLTLKRKDIKITDSEENEVTEVEEGQLVIFYPITIRNDGNFQAEDVAVEVRLDTKAGELLYTETVDIDANTVKNLNEFNWTAQGQGSHKIWVLCLVDSDNNEEVRYDNNNMSKSLLVRPQYGLELAIDDKFETIDVNHTASFIFNITNVGLQTDNYIVNVSVLNPKWTITYPSVVSSVESNTTKNFTVDFVPKINVTAREHLFTITVTSDGNASRIESEVVSITVNQYFGLNVSMPLTYQRAFPNTEITYPVRVTNEGNGVDTFDLFIDFDWGANTWIDDSVSSSVSIGSFRTVNVEIRLTTPSDGSPGDYQLIELTVISQGDNSVAESVTSNTSIGIMMAEKAVVGVLPGENASFSIIFENPTNATDIFDISIDSGAPDWSSSISPTSFNLSSEEQGQSSINFTAPNTAKPGDFFEIQLTFGNGEVSDTITIVLEVNDIQGIRLWSIDDTFVSYSDPGETAYFNIRVVNYEDQALTIDLSHEEAYIPGWTVAYNTYSTWSKTIPGGSSTTVNVTITSPDNTEAIETGWLRVIGTVDGFEPAFFDANVTINQTFGLSISSKSTITLLGNVSELVRLSITNTGNGPDVFEIRYLGDWIDDDTDTISFDGFETKEISFVVNSGLVAPGTSSSVFLEVNSTKSLDTDVIISENTTLSFVVTGLQSVGSTSISLNPGESTSIEVLMVSLIDSNPTSRMITDISGTSQYWADFNNTEEFEEQKTYVVTVGQPQVFSVDLSAPSIVVAGDYTLTLEIVDYYNSSHISTLTYTITILQQYDISLVPTSTTSVTNPGFSPEWVLRITNNGNGPDTVNMALSGLPEFWEYTYHSDEVINLESTFSSPNTKAIVLTVSVPDNATSGDFNFTIIAESIGDSKQLVMNITVNAVYKITASPIGDIELIGNPGGDPVYFQFKVTNLGNTEDTVVIDYAGSLSPSAGDFEWVNKTLSISQESTNYLRAPVPLTNDGPWTAVVTVSSLGNPSISTTITFTLNGFSLPDVGISQLTLMPPNPTPGEKVKLSFTVTAEDADVSSVYYTVYIDGEVYGGERITGISKGGSKPIIFDFIAEEGSHTITVRLDESDELSDPNTSNNVAQQTYVAESSGSSNLAIYLIVIALASVSAAVYYRYSRKEKSISSKKNIRLAPVVSEPSLSFPLVLNCVQCGSRVRVARPGSFRCPSCKEVSSVDSNGEIKSSDKPPETKVRRRPSTSSDESERPKLVSRRSRMEAFLSPDKSEDIEEEVEEKKLSASERLRQLREETELESSEVVIEESLDDEPDEVENTESAKEEKSKKRKDPPKGGSFGPTVGGF